jgi:hypothetical protein
MPVRLRLVAPVIVCAIFLQKPIQSQAGSPSVERPTPPAASRVFLDMREPANRARAEVVFRAVGEVLPGWTRQRLPGSEELWEDAFFVSPESPPTRWAAYLQVRIILAATEARANEGIVMQRSVSPTNRVSYNGYTVHQWEGWNRLATSVGKVGLSLDSTGLDETRIKAALAAALDAAKTLQL